MIRFSNEGDWDMPDTTHLHNFRKEFEQWARDHGWGTLRKSSGQYNDARTRSAWAATCWMRYGRSDEIATPPGFSRVAVQVAHDKAGIVKGVDDALPR